MGLSTFSEICNFKGRKVIEKSAFGGSNAPSAITFEPFDRKISYLGNQCILPNPILWWKDKKIDPKIWSKFGQTWPNLGQFFFHSKVSNKWTHMHEKSWFSKKLLIGLTLAKSAKSKFCQTVTNKGKIIQAWFFMHMGPFIWHFWMKKILTQIWPSLTKFWPNFEPKKNFLSPQNGIFQNALIPQVWTFYLTWFKSYSTWCI